MTMTLMVLCTAVYIATRTAGVSETHDYVRLGAQFGPALWDGQFWRLGVSMFLHGNTLHLVMNLYALYILGWTLEPLLGHRRFLALFLLGGLAGSACSSVIHPMRVSIGASGAVFTLAGAAFIGRVFFVGDMRKTLLEPFGLYLGLFILYSLVSGFMQSGVDNAAHLGGLVAGVLLGGHLALISSKTRTCSSRSLILFILGLIFIITSVVYSIRPRFSSSWAAWKAERMMQSGRHGEAETFLREAIHRQPSNAEFHIRLAVIKINQGHDQEAFEIYERAARVVDDPALIHLVTGFLYVYKGDADSALISARRARDGGDRGSGSDILKAYCHWIRGSDEDALDLAAQALKNASNDPAALQACLFFLTRPGAEPQPRILAMLEALGEDPEATETVMEFAALYLKHFRMYDQAVLKYERLLAGDGDAVLSHRLEYVSCLAALNRHAEADREINRFLGDLPPGDYPGIPFHRNLALLIRLRSAGIQNKPRHEIMELRAAIEENYRLELKQDSSALILNNLAFHFAEEDYNTTEGLLLAQESVKKEPRSWNWDTLAWCRYRTGDLEGALLAVDESVRLLEEENHQKIALLFSSNPDMQSLQVHTQPAEHRYHRAVILHALGRREEAAGELRPLLHQPVHSDVIEQARNLLSRLDLSHDL